MDLESGHGCPCLPLVGWMTEEMVGQVPFMGFVQCVFNGPEISRSQESVNPKLCDPSVKQYSGYFDIAGDKHLFFW